jgi:hypothetical protein
VIKDPTKPTALLDQFTGTRPNDPTPRPKSALSSSLSPKESKAESSGSVFSAEFGKKPNEMERI